MNKYITTNNETITDVFFSYQAEKMKNQDKILFESDATEIKHEINGKSISNEDGLFIFKWNGSEAIEKTQLEIDNDNAAEIIVIANDKKKAELSGIQTKIVYLLVTLIKQLLADGTIQATDFSETERAVYQQAKNLIEDIDWS